MVEYLKNRFYIKKIQSINRIGDEIEQWIFRSCLYINNGINKNWKLLKHIKSYYKVFSLVIVRDNWGAEYGWTLLCLRVIIGQTCGKIVLFPSHWWH